MARIFISYRREDSSAAAGRLHDRLRERYGRDTVFMDIDTIEPGVDFIEAIQRTVASCDVLITLIGRQWLTISDAAGQRRLENSDDFVRQEIATALRRNIRVIPTLIQGTRIPTSADFPGDLKPLTRRNALELSDAHFHRDVDGLIETLDRVLGMESSSASRAGTSSTPMPPLGSAQGATADARARSVSGWRVELLSTSRFRRKLRLYLTQDTHTIEFRWSWKDSVEVDGERVSEGYGFDNTHVFEVSDGEVRYPAKVVVTGIVGIIGFRLLISGHELYSEGN